MTDWSLGYNVDFGYTYGHYRELDPHWLDLCSILKGVRPPSLDASTADNWRYLELGCGQGVNLCIIAALHPEHEFVGIDFNPQHIAHAQALATSAGLTNVRFVEGDFAKLGESWPTELGQFHYAAAHGVLSWIAQSVREGLYRCLFHCLAPGGIFYGSYNSMPGWISAQPVQHLLRLWQVREGMSSLKAIEKGSKRLSALADAGAAVIQALPGMKKRIDKLDTLERSYVMQEYLNDAWNPFWFDEVEADATGAKLRYVGTASATDWYLPTMLTKQKRALLEQFDDPVEREVMLDVLVNQYFRRDLYVRGRSPLWQAEQRLSLQSLKVALVKIPVAAEGDNPYKYDTSLGEVKGKPEVYAPLYEALKDGPKSLYDLVQQPSPTVRTMADTLQAVGFMLDEGHAAIHMPPNNPIVVQNLNRAMAKATLNGAPYHFLIAPALPMVLMVPETELMFLALTPEDGVSDAETLATELVERLLLMNKGLKQESEALTQREVMLPRARKLAQRFVEKTIPGWKRLGVVG